MVPSSGDLAVPALDGQQEQSLNNNANSITENMPHHSHAGFDTAHDTTSNDPSKRTQKNNNETFHELDPDSNIDTIDQDPFLEEIKVKEEDTEDPEVVFIGSRPCIQTTPFPLPIDTQGPNKKRKRSSVGNKERRKKQGTGEPGKPHGRPKKYLWDEKESESDFVLSDLDENEWSLARSEMPTDTTRRKTSRWVCYSEIEEKMFLHWLVQGRSLNYVVNAFKGLRSRNGLYQKMAAIRRQFDNTKFNVDKNSHFEMSRDGISSPGPIPHQDLHEFKIVLFEMRNKPSLKQRISGETKEQQEGEVPAGVIDPQVEL